MALPSNVILRGTRAGQPAATARAAGTVYVVTDEGDKWERTNGTTWDDVTPNSTATGALGGSLGATDNAILRADGTGGATAQGSALSIDDTGVISFPDNVRQTFNPGADAAGINVGSIAGDPGTPSNGDLWYDSTANELTARINGANVALGAGGGSGDPWIITLKPNDNEPPASNYATLDLRNNHPVLDFDATTQEAAVFSSVLPFGYGGAGVTVYVYFAATSATIGTIGWDVAFERMDTSSLDIDADSFATAQTITAATVPGTSGQILRSSVNISNGANMDSLAAGEAFRLRVRRDVANDDATGDAELLRVVIVEQ